MRIIFAVSLAILLHWTSAIRTAPPPNHDWLAYLAESSMNRLEILNKTGYLYTSQSIPLGMQVRYALEIPNIPSKFEKIFLDIKEKLPTSVRIVTFGEVTFMVNRFAQEYLYADSDEVFDYKRRNVYTWRKSSELSNPQGRWRFETKDKGQTFYLRNDHYDETLYADDDSYSYNEKRRRVFTWRPKGTVYGARWMVEIVNNDEIRLKNVFYKEFLYAVQGYKDESRRFVFTWRDLEDSDHYDAYCWKLNKAQQ